MSTLKREEKEHENTLAMKKLNQRQVQHHEKEEINDMKIKFLLLSNVVMCCHEMCWRMEMKDDLEDSRGSWNNEGLKDTREDPEVNRNMHDNVNNENYFDEKETDTLDENVKMQKEVTKSGSENNSSSNREIYDF